MLDAFVKYTLRHDLNFFRFWDERDRIEQAAILEHLCALDSLVSALGPELPERFGAASTALFRETAFLRVRSVAHSRIPDSWIVHCTDQDFLRDAMTSVEEELSAFLDRRKDHGAVRLYGGLKAVQSQLRRRAEQASIRRDTGMGQVRDRWDYLRFRVVFEDVKSVVEASMAIWKRYGDAVVKCKNHYQSKSRRKRFRAVLFVLARDGFVFELQLMTSRRESVSLLDHALLFKRNLDPMDETHLPWLRKISMAADILDAR